jgi:hypothetical protein
MTDTSKKRVGILAMKREDNAKLQGIELAMTPSGDTIRSAIDGVDKVARDMDQKWGVGRLRLVVSDELGRKFDIQMDKLDAAVASGSAELVQRHSAAMKRAYEVLDKAAYDAGASPMLQQAAETAAAKPQPPVGMEIGDEGTLQGRNPLELPAEIFADLGHGPQPVLSAIRKKCLDCCGEAPSEVRRCTSVKCALWPYRMGSNPFRKARELSDEEKLAMRDRLAAARVQKLNPKGNGEEASCGDHHDGTAQTDLA